MSQEDPTNSVAGALLGDDAAPDFKTGVAGEASIRSLRDEMMAKGLTEAQATFVELDRQYAANKAAHRKALDAVLHENRIGAMFQDPVHGTVYRVAEKKWTSVEMLHTEVQHTVRKDLGEEKGSVSIKDAEAAGFTL